MIYSRSLFW